MAPDVAGRNAKQAELLKQNGNTYFNKEKIGAAIEAYTEAITLCPKVPVYWTNRALCHRKRGDWKNVESDCRSALALDSNSVKAHYMLGLALLQSETFEDGVKHLEKALELGREANPSSYMVEDIWQELAKAKYLEWESYSNLILQKQQDFRQLCEVALQRECERTRLQSSEGDLESVQNKKNSSEEWRSALNDVFKKAQEDYIPTEVPEYLCCKITLDILRDPVITPNGVTYERAAILDHLKKVGKFDPVTREPLKHDQLVPNLAIKEAVQSFLDKHGWAYNIA